jgi:type I restriction enzyme S subunit
MNHWPQKRLEEISDLINGRAFEPSEWSDKGTPIIRIQNLNDPSKPYNYYDGSLPEKYRVRTGDILLSWSGTPGTSFGCFRWKGPEGWLNQHIFNVKLRGGLHPDFFVYQVNSMLGQLIAMAHGGVGLQHVTKGMVGNLIISIPTMPEQERIVQILCQADELRQLRADADRLGASLTSSLFHEMFGEPNRWTQEPLQKLLVGIESGWSPVCRDEPAKPAEWGVLKLSSVTFGEYREEENKALPEGTAPRPGLEVRRGDVLFTRKNTYALVAATAYVWSTRPRLMLSDLIFRLRPRPEVGLDPLYLCYSLAGLPKRGEIQRLAGGSAGSMPNISKERLLSVSISLPPLHLQQYFALHAKEIRDLQAEQIARRERLNDLFHSLLHRAFQGDL